jgi:signal peptidase I
VRRLFFLLALGAFGAAVFRVFLFENVVIASASMEPTLPVGRTYWVNKAIYRWGAPQRGELIVFRGADGQKGMVKRVVAVAGDTVRFKDKELYLNGVRQLESYVRYTRAGEILVGDNLDLGVVPPGHVVVLGDNRDESGDSRDWKDADGDRTPFLPLDRVNGRLVR